MNDKGSNELRLSEFCVCLMAMSLILISGSNVIAKTAVDMAPDEIAPLKAPFQMADLQRPVFPDHIFNIVDFGGINDGKTKNTEAFSKTIDACNKAGGGTVLVPAGEWFTGPIHLKSNINLHLAESAKIIFSDVFEDYLPVVFTRYECMECYNYSSLIYAYDCNNVAITGKGELVGNGKAWWDWRNRLGKMARGSVDKLYDKVMEGVAVKDRIFGSREFFLRPSFVQFVNCRNVLVEGITIGSGPAWTLHFIYCDGIIVRKTTFRNKGPNNDGLDLDSSRNALVEYCHFETADDGPTLKSGLNEDGWRVNKPTENIVIRHCSQRRGTASLTMGSEMSGGIRNVFVHDCNISGVSNGIWIKSMRGRGGIVENIWIQDIAMKKIAGYAICLDMFYGASTIKPRSDKPPVFRNINIKNVHCENANQSVRIVGLPDSPIQNVVLENICVASANGGLKAVDVNGLKLTSIDIVPKKGPVMKFNNITDVEIAEPVALDK